MKRIAFVYPKQQQMGKKGRKFWKLFDLKSKYETWIVRQKSDLKRTPKAVGFFNPKYLLGSLLVKKKKKAIVK